MWLGIHKSYKFIQLSKANVVRHAQSEWKQRVSYTSKMNLSMNKIFRMCLGIPKCN